MTARPDPGARRAFGLCEMEPVGIVVLSDATVLRVGSTGAVAAVLPGGHPHAGAASDPSNSGRPRRWP